MWYVYKTTCLINEKIYIGVRKSEDIENDPYLGSGLLLKKYLAKYGNAQFKRQILFVFNSAEEAYAKERELVNEDFLNNENTLNLSLGGHGGSGPASCLSYETRILNAAAAKVKLTGRTKETHQYLLDTSIKLSAIWKSKSESELKQHGEKSTKWMNDKEKKKLAYLKAAEKNKEKTKENCEGRRRQSEIMKHLMNNGLAQVIAEKNKGKTKENCEGKRRQAAKISGENSSNRREDVKQKISKAVSGDKNGMFGVFGENSPVSVLSNVERIKIIDLFEAGVTRKELYDKYKDISESTIKKLIQNREIIKKRILEEVTK